MTTDSYEVLEFHLNRDVPNAGGFVLALAGAGWLAFSIADESAPAALAVVGLVLLILSVMAFTFRVVVRMDNRSGKIEKTISALFWKRYCSYSVADFRAVGIGTARGSLAGGKIAPGSAYLVQLVGRTHVNIPGTSSNKDTIIALAERIGAYLDLPVDKQPKVAFFQKRWGRGGGA